MHDVPGNPKLRRRRRHIGSRVLSARLARRVDGHLGGVVVTTGAGAAAGDELAVLQRDELDVRRRAVLGQEVRPVEAHARLGVDQVRPEARRERALHLERRRARRQRRGRHLAVGGRVDTGGVDDLSCSLASVSGLRTKLGVSVLTIVSEGQALVARDATNLGEDLRASGRGTGSCRCGCAGSLRAGLFVTAAPRFDGGGADVGGGEDESEELHGVYWMILKRFRK